MTSDSIAQAIFDVLAIGRRLEKSLGGPTGGEIQLIAYLSCLLAIYNGRPAADWGYRFVCSSWGAPYSPAMQEALVQASGGGLIIGGDSVQLSEEGKEFLDFLSPLSQHSWRVQSIDGATASVLSFPAGVIRDSLRQEPGLRLGSLHSGAQSLLDDSSLDLLYEQFRGLNDAVGPASHDLMIPAVVWLRYLAETSDDAADFDSAAQVVQASAVAGMASKNA